jgi:hypothetical protein
MTTLFELSVPNYSRMIATAIHLLEQGKQHCEEKGKKLDDLATLRMIDDMAPLATQVYFINHMSVNAVKGFFAGEFSPPTGFPDLDYDGLIGYMHESKTFIDQQSPEDINALAGQAVIFKFADREIPFTIENFVQSFSLPNLYFHVTTLYDLLRKEGVALSKRDYLGKMAIGIPE